MMNDNNNNNTVEDIYVRKKKKKKEYNNPTPALSVHPRTSLTHLLKSVFIKNRCESVNTWDSNERLSGHGSSCHSVKQWHPDLRDPETKTDVAETFLTEFVMFPNVHTNTNIMLRLYHIHRLMQCHSKSMQCSILQHIDLNDFFFFFFYFCGSGQSKYKVSK